VRSGRGEIETNGLVSFEAISKAGKGFNPEAARSLAGMLGTY
jgi:hypothetical protein